MKIILLHLFLLFMYVNKRELLIFYNQYGIALKNKQLIELEKDKAGIKERDLVIYTFKTTTAAAIEKWNIDTTKTFTILLIGKDGGEKLRSDSVLTTTKLFSTIDAMPMRKREMKGE